MRKIIHIDADSFYASVEMRDQPELLGTPIAVGGSAEHRGVIATCNYEARKFGVHSAMSSARALTQCPALLILPPRFELYREVSRQFHEIFRRYTEIIEPLSLDEAFLDVTHCEQFSGSATLIARDIRQHVKDELNLTVSAGVAPNKFLAKVASDWNKPDGIFTIAPDEVAEFVRTLPVRKINGVGKVMARKLGRLGVETCGDLQQVPLSDLIRQFGKYGQRLADVAQGVDHRPVQTSRVRKSISVERTFATDLADQAAIQVAMPDLLQELVRRFAAINDRYLPVKRVVKLKFQDFTQTTLEEGLSISGEEWCTRARFGEMLDVAWARAEKPVRLVGLGLRLQPRVTEKREQLPLFTALDQASETGQMP